MRAGRLTVSPRREDRRLLKADAFFEGCRLDWLDNGTHPCVSVGGTVALALQAGQFKADKVSQKRGRLQQDQFGQGQFLGGGKRSGHTIEARRSRTRRLFKRVSHFSARLPAVNTITALITA